MSAWPEELEELLASVNLPTADLNVGLKEFVRLLCGVLDIPTYKSSTVESLYVMFSVFSEFQDSQHFHRQRRESLLDRLKDNQKDIRRIVTPPQDMLSPELDAESGDPVTVDRSFLDEG